jgi:hypothetical protein
MKSVLDGLRKKLDSTNLLPLIYVEANLIFEGLPKIHELMIHCALSTLQ